MLVASGAPIIGILRLDRKRKYTIHTKLLLTNAYGANKGNRRMRLNHRLQVEGSKIGTKLMRY